MESKAVFFVAQMPLVALGESVNPCSFGSGKIQCSSTVAVQQNLVDPRIHET